MHPQRQSIPCRFEDASVPACIPVRILTQANGEGAAAIRRKTGSGNVMAVIILKKMPEVAPKGQNPGVFTDIKQETGKDDLGKDFNRLKKIVTLEAKDADGKPYTVEKTYNL